MSPSSQPPKLNQETFHPGFRTSQWHHGVSGIHNWCKDESENALRLQIRSSKSRNYKFHLSKSFFPEILLPFIRNCPDRDIFVPDGNFIVSSRTLLNFMILCVTVETLILLYFEWY